MINNSKVLLQIHKKKKKTLHQLSLKKLKPRWYYISHSKEMDFW
jgi:hypothetical protein